MWEFTTTNKLIELIQEHRKTSNNIIFKDGVLKSNIYTCNILECIKEIANNEVPKDGDEFERIMICTHDFVDGVEAYNNYNYTGNSSEVIEYHIYKGWDNYYIGIAVHLDGDVRYNYTPMVLYKFDSYEDFAAAFETEYEIETENWNAKLSCSALSELNSVYVDTHDGIVFSFVIWEWYKEDIVQCINDMIDEGKESDECTH